MKHFLLKTWLTMLCLLFGVGTMWAEKITDYANIVSGKKYYIGATSSSTDYYLSVNGSSTSTSIAGTAVADKSNATAFVFEGSGTSWTIKFDGTSNYLGLNSSKDNGKVQVVSSAATFTLSNQSSKIRLTIGSYSVQKNNSGTQFGSYANTQTDVWLEEVSSGGSTKYTVTVANDIANGTVTASSTSAAAGATVTLTATPSTGYEFGSWNVTDASSNAITVTDNKFTMPASNVNVSATFNVAPPHADFIFNTDAGLSALGISKPTTGQGTNLGSSSYTSEPIIMTATDGGTATRVWNSGGTTTLRAYNNGGSLTFSGATITKIVFTGTVPMTANVGTFSEKTWTGEATSVTFTATGSVTINTIEVTYASNGKTTPTLSFAKPTYNATMGESFEAPTLNNPKNVAVTYSSSEGGVATVDSESGTISLVAPGTTTITASFAGDEDYNEASARYELVVAAAPNKYAVTIEAPENGTLTVTCDDVDVVSGNTYAVGKNIRIVATPADGYKVRNIQVVDETTHTFTASNEKVWTMGEHEISITANFDVIPTYTVAFSVNGVEVQSENLKEGAAVIAYADPEAINGKVFTGWIETATVVGETPAYVTPITTATKTVTYYAVFATQEGAAGGEVTEELTNAEVNGLSSTAALAYATETTYTDGTVDYSIYAYTDQANRKWIQVKKDQNVYVKMTAPSPIKNVEVTLTAPTNSSGGINDITKHTAYSGTVALCAADCAYTTSSASVASTSTITNNVATLEPTGDNNILYLKVSTGARIWSISVTYGSNPTYSDFTTTPGWVILDENSTSTEEVVEEEVNVKVKRAIRAGYWSPLCLPFNMTAEQITANFGEDAEVKAFSDLAINGDNYSLKFSDASTIKSGKAYMVRLQNPITEIIVNAVDVYMAKDAYDSDDQVAEDEEENVIGVTFQGNFYNNTTVPEGSYIINSNKFYFVNSTVTNKGFRGYFTIASSADSNKARNLSFSFDDVLTGIEGITVEGIDNSIFDLQGRRVQRLQKGVNIVNGKKVIR